MVCISIPSDTERDQLVYTGFIHETSISSRKQRNAMTTCNCVIKSLTIFLPFDYVLHKKRKATTPLHTAKQIFDTESVRRPL